MKIDITSWNPFTGCTKVSPACKHCYAETLSEKLHMWGTSGYENKFEFTVHTNRLINAAPLKRKKPTLYFVNSMSDTFHENVSDDILDALFDIISQATQHNFYVLTKRSERMLMFFKRRTVPTNVWLGVTVEDRKHGIPRLADLHKIETLNKHICCEPLLEDLGAIDLSGIRLVVGGGESGSHARRTQLTWVESLIQQCEQQHVDLYWKSWGKYNQEGKTVRKNASPLVNNKEYLTFPKDLMPSMSAQRTIDFKHRISITECL